LGPTAIRKVFAGSPRSPGSALWHRGGKATPVPHFLAPAGTQVQKRLCNGGWGHCSPRGLDPTPKGADHLREGGARCLIWLSKFIFSGKTHRFGKAGLPAFGSIQWLAGPWCVHAAGWHWGTRCFRACFCNCLGNSMAQLGIGLGSLEGQAGGNQICDNLPGWTNLPLLPKKGLCVKTETTLGLPGLTMLARGLKVEKKKFCGTWGKI